MIKRVFRCAGVLSFALCSSLPGDASSKVWSDLTQAECVAKKGFWGSVNVNQEPKCWPGDFEQSISANDIEDIVRLEIERSNLANVTLDDEPFPILSHFFDLLEDGIFILLSFGPANDAQTIAIAASENGAHAALLAKGTQVTSESEDTIEEILSHATARGAMSLVTAEDGMSATGILTSSDGRVSKKISLRIPEELIGLGSTEIRVVGDEAFINGTLGSITFKQISDLLEKDENVKTLVLENVPGSMNDLVNVHTGRLIHTAGLTTKVLENSEIASGGVDLFAAGVERIVESGARIGVHSWCCVEEYTASDLPKDHPGHRHQLDYFSLVMGEKKGPAFYRFTINAAPFDGVHWMSEDEIIDYSLATQILRD